MALRPFSLLLLLVMIPASFMLQRTIFDLYTECHKDTWFCFKFTESPDQFYQITDSATGALGTGGVALDTTLPDDWKVIYTFLFDDAGPENGCSNFIIASSKTTEIRCMDVIDEKNLPKINEISIWPYRWCYKKYILEYRLKVPTGSYVSDSLELFADPSMRIGFFKYRLIGGMFGEEAAKKYSEGFKPFKCYIADRSPPYPTATMADEQDNKFSCKDGYHISLGGTNTYQQSVYCSQGGWRYTTTKEYILQQAAADKKHPHCIEDTMFKDCTTNGCFVFGDGLIPPQSALALVKEEKTAKIGVKLGAYVQYESDTSWTLLLAYKKELVSFTIGDDVITIGSQPKIVGNKITATTISAGPRLSSGIETKLFKLESSQSEKDLMTVLGFYKDTKNQIILTFKTGAVAAKGVANHRKYKVNHNKPFIGVGTAATLLPGEDNLFACEPGKALYVNGAAMAQNVVRFTAKGWLFGDGQIASVFNKQDGIALVENVYCVSVCEESVIGLIGATPQPVKPTGKLEYTCSGNFVRVDGKLHDKISCVNNQWLGDGQALAMPSSGKQFKLECYGVGRFYKECSDNDKKAGCGKVNPNNHVLTCDPGFTLTLGGTGRTDENTIRSSLTLKKDGTWVADGASLGNAADTDKVSCNSKCSPAQVDTKAQHADGERAQYIYDANSNTAILKCSSPDVLVSDLEGADKSYIKDFTCNKDGWTEIGDTNLKKKFAGVTNVDGLKVKAYCFKVCGLTRVKETPCETQPAMLDCNKPIFDGTKLTCSPTHVLIVNSNPLAQPPHDKLECKREGWFHNTALIIDHKTNFKDPVTAQCFAKCGAKFITGNAPTPTSTANGIQIACTGSQMISYQATGIPNPVDTLDDLVCEKDSGWKVAGSSTLFAKFTGAIPIVDAKCKPSCSGGLIKDICAGRPKCSLPTFNDAESKFTCAEDSVLVAMVKDNEEGAVGSMQCSKKAFEATMLAKSASYAKDAKVSIPRTSPTVQAGAACLSLCDEKFFKVDPATASILVADQGKPNYLKKTSHAIGDHTMSCTDPLRYTKISYDTTPDVKWYRKEFQCTKGKLTAPGLDPGLYKGQTAIVGCQNKCEDRLKTDACNGVSDCKLPTLDVNSNELKCDAGYILRTKQGNVETLFSNIALTCEKDGFHVPQELVLAFKDNEDEDMKQKFDVVCISKCATQFVKLADGSEVTSTSNPSRSTTDLKCLGPDPAGAGFALATDQILVTWQEKDKKRVFGAATCVATKGWKGRVSLPDPLPPAARTSWKIDGGTTESTILNFDHVIPEMNASCVKVCSTELINDVCAGAATKALHCGEAKYTNTEVKCSEHHRIFINGKNSGKRGAANIISCDYEGWKEGTDALIEFKDMDIDISKKVDVICKHKCHEDFVEFSDTPCPPGNTCSKANYINGKLNCSDPTEILFLEYNNGKMDSFDDATCSDKGWTSKDAAGNEVVLFAMDQHDYHVKVRCEQLCPRPTMANSISFDETTKTITCEEVNEMLALDDKGVYSDMTCSKEGWKTAGNELKVAFTPTIYAPTATRSAERAKKFTCVSNDCMRPGPCTDPAQCDGLTDPNVKAKKYEMSCELPGRLIKKQSDVDVAAKKTPIYYEDVKCVADADGHGEWKQVKDNTVLEAALDDDARGKAVSERSPFGLVCSFTECTLCTRDEKKEIESQSDTNYEKPNFKTGVHTTCAKYECAGKHYALRENEKNTYYFNDGSKFITCKGQNEGFTRPDGVTLLGSALIGCVTQIPCFEYEEAQLQTDCAGLTKQNLECNSEEFQKKLEAGSKKSSVGSDLAPVMCNEQGTMYYQTGKKNAWSVVKQLQCGKDGLWTAQVQKSKNEEDGINEVTLRATKEKDGPKRLPRVICSLTDPNPDVDVEKADAKTHTCDESWCPPIPALECEGCTKADNVIIKNNLGNGICEAKIESGRFVFNDNRQETTERLTCQNMNNKYEWKTSDGTVVKSLAVKVTLADKMSTGAMAGIVVACVIVLAAIIAAIVYLRIRRKREIERQEKLKSKGLEQKQDTIIDNVTIVEDSKTLVL